MVDTPGRRATRRRVVYPDPRVGYGPSGYSDNRGFGPYEGSCRGLFGAAAEAIADLIVGSSRVASTWLVETSDAVFGRRYVVDDLENFEDDEFVDQAAASSEDAFDEEEELVYGPAPSVMDTFNRAFREGARVVGRSAERFASEYDRYG